ncbi:Uncharacterised protein [Mycobacterium tuberculosis]|uniref:Uncharacterized protein n=1 Tax=Mycobacterium tuberculosis TaxID=1773 RepID=A0A655HV10_MYCTX|nr:Uncharacterised protein [Mycobacterium tuberculosis]CNN06895.1 Uncharacterised protein [Mycobacterium tuberculosis]CNN63790.1 Uncharacterised protein [Mycobacterium tuberculosis]COV13436.1 Uncharacterised protein [Mycobacterium tuberculosis]COV32548.1 Uncharacterised protein [Mycobacterium tuberculosis]
MGRSAQPAIQPIAPQVVLAGQRVDAPRTGFHHQHQPVPADRRKSVQLPVDVPHHHDRLPCDGHGDVVTGLGELVDMRDKHPGPVEDPFPLQLPQLR